MTSEEQFDALLAFNGEAVPYCEGISDPVAREHARVYMRVLQSRAKGSEADAVQIPLHLFGPTRNLIEATLRRMYHKHFPATRRARF